MIVASGASFETDRMLGKNHSSEAGKLFQDRNVLKAIIFCWIDWETNRDSGKINKLSNTIKRVFRDDNEYSLIPFVS
jgi:hypothetical protein